VIPDSKFTNRIRSTWRKIPLRARTIFHFPTQFSRISLPRGLRPFSWLIAFHLISVISFALLTIFCCHFSLRFSLRKTLKFVVH